MRLRRARFDLVIDLHGGPRSAWLTLATGAPCRIGYDIQGGGGSARPWSTGRGVAPAALRQTSGTCSPRFLGGRTTDRARDAVFMAADADADARVARRLADAGVRNGIR